MFLHVWYTYGDHWKPPTLALKTADPSALRQDLGFPAIKLDWMTDVDETSRLFQGGGPRAPAPPRQSENMENYIFIFCICYKCAVEVCGNKVIILHGDVLELTRIILIYEDIDVSVLGMLHLS